MINVRHAMVKRQFQQKKIIEFNIEKGTSNGEKIIFDKEGDNGPDIDIPGNIIIQINQVEHDYFLRNQHDLVLKKTISLHDALCGIDMMVKHLDNRVLKIKTKPQNIISHGEVYIIPKEGMHTNNNIGNLLIIFYIEMPTSLPDDIIKILHQILPTSPNTNSYDGCIIEEKYIQKTNKKISEQKEQSQCIHQ